MNQKYAKAVGCEVEIRLVSAQESTSGPAE